MVSPFLLLWSSNILDNSNWWMMVEYLGTARGCGWQKIGAFVNLGAYYIVGIPSAVLLAFVLHIGGKVNILLLFAVNLVLNISICLKLYES